MARYSPIRVEDPALKWLGTSRTVNSLLWFVNNKDLEEHNLGYLGKYVEKYEVEAYAFVWQGNHHHLVARFPNCNRADFYRDLNARYAESLRYFVPEFPGGPVFARKYSAEALPIDADVEKYFFYCALNAVHAGLVEYPSEYPAYNSFWDAINDRERKVKVFNRAEFNEAKRSNPHVRKKDFYSYHVLKFKRLPGYEHLPTNEYKKLMLEKLEQHRQAIVLPMKQRGHKFLTRAQLLKVVPGSAPKNTKTSERLDHRPIVLTICSEARQKYKTWYFSHKYEPYKCASRSYRAGDELAVFPPGTYKPPSCCKRPTIEESFLALA